MLDMTFLLSIILMDTPSITDVSAMRAALVEAQLHAKAVQDHANSLDAELANAKARNSDMTAHIALLEFQNEKMRRALYGQKAERSIRLVDQLELTLLPRRPTKSRRPIARNVIRRFR